MVRYGSARGRGRNVYAALPDEPGWRYQLRARWADASGTQLLKYSLFLLIPVAMWLGWYGARYSVRAEARRIEAHLLSISNTSDETLRNLMTVELKLPVFAITMPESVTVEAVGFPKGSFQTETKIELSGTYTSATREVHLKGQKQSLFPYRRLVVDWKYIVPPG